MQLYSHTLTWIAVSVCVLRVNTRHRVKKLYPKRSVLGPNKRKAIWSRMQLSSYTQTWIAISVCVLRVNTRRPVKNLSPKQLVLGSK
jgi:hypothetical protein